MGGLGFPTQWYQQFAPCEYSVTPTGTAGADGFPSTSPSRRPGAVAYYSVLHLFDLLQAAGPDLNPRTFQQGAFSMPTSAPGDVGVWTGGAEAYGPVTTTQIGWWDPSATSNFDGKQGARESCEGGKWFTFLDPNAWQPNHTQLQCFGK